MEIDHLLRDLGRERGIADPHQSIVGKDFDHQPAMKSERLHRSFGQIQHVHGIGAEMRRQGNRLPAPAHYASTNLFDSHQAPE